MFPRRSLYLVVLCVAILAVPCGADSAPAAESTRSKISTIISDAIKVALPNVSSLRRAVR